MDLQTMFKVGSQSTIIQESGMMGLEHDQLSGVTGQSLCEASGGPAYWRLGLAERQRWDARAARANAKAKEFWISYLDPVSTTPAGVNDVLEAILHHKLPRYPYQDMIEAQINANLAIALFPYLGDFTPRQDKMLLDIFASTYWYDSDDEFRLYTGTDVLFSHGKPTVNIINKMIPRALSWEKPYDELVALISGIGLPIQKQWKDIAGRRVLDLCLVMLSPERPRPPGHPGRTVPGDKILEVALTSPEAVKLLMPVVLNMCRRHMISTPAEHVLEMAESFGVDLEGSPGVVDWIRKHGETNPATTRRLNKLLAEGKAGKLTINAGARVCGMCFKATDTIKLRRCGGCFVLLYCSEDCQTRAWADGHKVVCKATAAAGRLPHE